MLVLLFIYFLIYRQGWESGGGGGLGGSSSRAGDNIYGRVPLKFTASLPSTIPIWAINHTLNQLPRHHARLLSISSHRPGRDGRTPPHGAAETRLLIDKRGNHNSAFPCTPSVFFKSRIEGFVVVFNWILPWFVTSHIFRANTDDRCIQAVF